MFKSPFSFEGRIRRTEYGLSIIIKLVAIISMFLIASLGSFAALIFIFYIPSLWFTLAQAVKRSHDLGNSGWFILIPFYGLWLLFAPGNAGKNEYGMDPKMSEALDAPLDMV